LLLSFGETKESKYRKIKAKNTKQKRKTHPQSPFQSLIAPAHPAASKSNPPHNQRIACPQSAERSFKGRLFFAYFLLARQKKVSIGK